MIKYFCLDIDKSDHGSKDYVSAISQSVMKLELSGLDTSKVKFIFISGGGAVQYMFPLLKEKEVLVSCAKQLNCQFHALNKYFESSCLKTFGK